MKNTMSKSANLLSTALRFAVLLLATSMAWSSVESLKLTQGEQYQLRSKEPIIRTAIGDPEVLGVKVINSRELLITAKASGSTSLMIWKKGHADKYRYSTTVTPPLPTGSSGFETQALAGGVVVSGSTTSLQQHDAVVSSLGEKVIDNTEFTGAVQVQTDIRIVEISRSQLKSAGSLLAKNTANTTAAIAPPGSLSGVSSGSAGAFSLLTSSGFLPSADAYSIIVGNAQKSILGVISALHNNGYAYTLAEPSLVSLSGQSASFLAGGEFPYPVSNENGQIDIEYREFGVRLRLTPTVLDENNIMLKVAPEVSELDFINGIQTGGIAVPSLRVRRTDTSVQLGSGESFIISGLISSNTQNNVDKVPGLGDLPILGAFFRSSRFEREDKELIMIVTPHLVRPMAANADIPELPGEVYRHHSPSFSDMLFGKAQPEQGEQSWAVPDIGFSN